MLMENIFYLVPIAAIVALSFAYYFFKQMMAESEGTDLMKKIALHVRKGAMAYLKQQYKVVTIVFVVLALIFAVMAYFDLQNAWVPFAFLTGGFFSGLAGFFGMKTATYASARTAFAAQESLNKGLTVAFRSGAVMGLTVVGLALLDISAWYLILDYFVDGTDHNKLIYITTTMLTFGMGASTQALFARVGGGIYTKAADVGADLVGKVEAGIPEDHPYNPATIADNVGDNVGDVAGMGADLFESYVGAIVGTMVLGAVFINIPGFESNNAFDGLNAVLLPLVLSGIGIVASIIGCFFVKVSEDGDPQKALNMGGIVSSILMLIATYLTVKYMLPAEWVYNDITYNSMGVFYAVIIGLVSGLAIGYITEYYTGTGTKPVKGIVDQSITGSATNIIAGLGVGMRSTALPIIVLSIAIIGAHYFAGLYGIAIAAVGMLANTGIQLAVDAYGPISDNAGGIAEMSGLDKEVRHRTDKLDAVGNTTAAIGKGFAIGSAALTALALFAAFMSTAGITTIDIANPVVMAGLFLGGMLPFLFSALSMSAVGRAAMDMIQEVRRQFNNIPELKAALAVMKKNEGKEENEWSAEDKHVYDQAEGKAEYSKCVEISTKASIREMVLPGLIAILSPVFIGFAGGAEMLGGLLAGVTVTGVLMAIFQSNAGGAWDNAKKMFEEGVNIQGTMYYKGSDPHKAAVVGDTVGDPFKDTSGPSLNILLKLMSVVALVIAPLL